MMTLDIDLDVEMDVESIKKTTENLRDHEKLPIWGASNYLQMYGKV